MTLDGFEERHMQVWLQNKLVHSEEVRPMFEKMRKWLEGLSDEDFAFWIDKGWPAVYEKVTGGEL